MNRLTFPKNRRLVTNGQFREVLSQQKRAGDELLIVYMAKNHCGYPRLGVSVGKNQGSAVVRNRLKRLIREAFRQSQGRIPADYDYVVMISRQWPKRSSDSKHTRKAAGKLKLGLIIESLVKLIDDAKSKAG